MTTFPWLASAEPYVFPSLTFSNLNGQEVAMPGGLAGERANLVLVAFVQEQQKDVDTWLKPLPAIQQAYPGFHYYELPTIKRVNGMVRYMIARGMRGGIPDKGQRGRTITLHVDKEPFKKSLGITSESTIYAFLIDKSGKVLWRQEGLFNEAKGKSLEAALSADSR